jgi:anaerobic ribonucleoside-triphosphate reductase activating protein
LDDVTDRLHRFWSASPPPSGLTVSGGEPFDQPEALLELLRRARGFGAGDILIYSGYRADILLERHPELRDLASALVDGPFEAGNVTESIWKGSENQSLTLLEERLSSRYEDWTRGKARKLQLVKSGDRDLLIGVPRQADVARLRKPDLSQET